MHSSKENRIEYSAEALQDLRQAMAWYQGHSTTAARLFGEEVRHITEMLRHFPRLGLEVGTHRRVLLRRFPYSLRYQIRDETILVAAIAHFRKSAAPD